MEYIAKISFDSFPESFNHLKEKELHHNVSRYINKQIHEDFYFDNLGRKQGRYVSYYDNGKILQECFYIDGKPEGDFKKYYNDGELEKHDKYKNGKKHGICRRFSKKGFCFSLFEVGSNEAGKTEIIDYYSEGNRTYDKEEIKRLIVEERFNQND